MKSLNFVYPEAQKLILVEEEVPAPGLNTILIKSIVSHVSLGTEMHCYGGDFDSFTNWAEWVKHPFRPGYSTAGRIVEVGKNVVDFKPGDLVYCGKPHAQYISVEYGENERNSLIGQPLYKIPDGLDTDEVIWSSMAGVAIVGCRKAKIEFGENVAVIGAGPIGQLTAQYARLCGAVRVVSIDTIKPKLDYAMQCGGATDVLAIAAEDAAPAIEELLGAKPEVVFDCTGNYRVLRHACDIVKEYGRIILNGDTPFPTKQSLGSALSKSIDLHPVHGMIAGQLHSLPWTAGRNTKMNFDFMLQKRIKVKDLITHRFKPQEAPEFYHMLYTDRSFPAVGVLFDW